MSDKNFNELCKNNNCAFYVEWEYQEFENEPPYNMVSCKLQGQSSDIKQIAKECPYRIWEVKQDVNS